MFPTIFGFIDTYSVMVVIGLIASFSIAFVYMKRVHMKKQDFLDLAICGCGAIICGIIFATLFQNLYDLILLKEAFQWSFKMTFFGGLFGGVIGFLFIYFVFIKKKSTLNINEILKIAPLCIVVAHAFGRIGCFCAGCCYGEESIHGLYFPILHKTVLPTQLYEAVFLFQLSGVLAILLFQFKFKYTFLVYGVSYSLFRFIIEFFRADDRGFSFLNLSPSQLWSIIIILGCIPLYFVLRSLLKKRL